MKTKYILLITLAVIFLSPLNINAESSQDISRKIETHLFELTSDDNWKVAKTTALIDSSGNERYSHFSTTNGEKDGYVVFDHQMNQVVEFSIDGNNLANKGIDSDSKRVYFFGPTLLYIEEDNRIENVSNPNDFHEKEVFITRLSKEETRVANLTSRNRVQNDMFMPTSTVWAQLPNPLPRYTYNPNGICGSTAAAMMLRYMDLYVNGNFVPTHLQSNDGVLLIKHLVPYIDGASPGSTAGEQSAGINTYLAGKVNYSTRVDYPYDYIFYASITYGRPFLLNLSGHPTFGYHAVTAYAYSDGWPVVNTGWSNPSTTYINPGYASWAVVFN